MALLAIVILLNSNRNVTIIEHLGSTLDQLIRLFRLVERYVRKIQKGLRRALKGESNYVKLVINRDFPRGHYNQIDLSASE
jgi:hypothetical protein